MINIGDKLKCVNNKPLEGNNVAPPLKVDEEYPVAKTYTCPPPCGQVHIDVGLQSNYGYISCYKCGTHLPETRVHWCHPTRFVTE